MSEELGPLLTFRIAFVSILPAFFAVMFWSIGHMYKLALDDKKFDAPPWVFEVYDLDGMKQDKPYKMYIGKVIAWAINISWILFLFSEPGCGRWVDQICQPIYSNAAFHNIALLDMGGIIVELTMFFILTGYFRWIVIREKQ